jgi:hypothetical protein
MGAFIFTPFIFIVFVSYLLTTPRRSIRDCWMTHLDDQWTGRARTTRITV